MSMSPGGDRHAAEIFGFDTAEDEIHKSDMKRNGNLYAARDDLLARSRALADRPHEAYQGERVAGMSGNEMQARTMAQNAPGGDARRYLDKAGGMIDQVANNEWNTETAQKFMNPYTDVVLDATLKRENQAYGQDLKTLQGQAKSRGAFGGDRQTMLESGLRKGHLETVGDLTGRTMHNAYENAAEMWRADNQRMSSAADAYRAVGGDISRMDTAQISDLMRTGQAGRVIEQMQLDSDYNAFIEERDWDVTNLQPLIAALSASNGAPVLPGGGNQGSGAGQAIGAIASLVGMFGGQTGAQSGSTGGAGAGMGTAPAMTGYGGSNGFDGGSGNIGTGMDGGPSMLA